MKKAHKHIRVATSDPSTIEKFRSIHYTQDDQSQDQIYTAALVQVFRHGETVRLKHFLTNKFSKISGWLEDRRDAYY